MEKEKIEYSQGEDSFKFHINRSSIDVARDECPVIAVMKILESLGYELVCDNDN